MKKPRRRESTSKKDPADPFPVGLEPAAVISPKVQILAFGLIFLSIVLRFTALDRIPSGSYVDESSIGYNAYSILITGADEHGIKLPLFFKAFGEFKNPVFIYTLVPLIQLFGLSLWTVRLGAALYGLGTAVVLGLIVKESLGRKWSWLVGFILAALTPWLFCISRIGFEVVSFPFFLTLGLWSWIRAVKSNSPYALFLCGTAWALSLLSYSTARLIVPVLVVATVGCYFREIRRIGTRSLLALVPLISIFFLLWLWNKSNPGSLVARFETISIWKDQADVLTVATRFLSNYLHYLSPAFLFVSGDPNLRHHTGNGGQLFLFTFPALVAGLVAAWQSRQRPLERFVLSGFLLFPLAASLTEDSSHSLRAIHGTPFMVLLTIWGFRLLWSMVERQRLLIGIFIAVAILETSTFYYDYFRGYVERSRPWFNAGVTELLRRAFEHRYTSLYYLPGVFRDEKLEGGYPYIQFLFLGRLDPKIYQMKGLEGFNIKIYGPGIGLPPGALLLIKDGEELSTVGGKKIAVKSSLPLPAEIEFVARIPAGSETDISYRIYRVP